jgi:hypothetical protein
MTSPENLGRQFDCNCKSALQKHLADALVTVDSAASDFRTHGFPETSNAQAEVAGHLRKASRALNKATGKHTSGDFGIAAQHLFEAQDAMNSAQFAVNYPGEPTSLGAALVSHAKSVGSSADKYAQGVSEHEAHHV